MQWEFGATHKALLLCVHVLEAILLAPDSHLLCCNLINLVLCGFLGSFAVCARFLLSDPFLLQAYLLLLFVLVALRSWIGTLFCSATATDFSSGINADAYDWWRGSGIEVTRSLMAALIPKQSISIMLSSGSTLAKKPLTVAFTFAGTLTPLHMESNLSSSLCCEGD